MNILLFTVDYIPFTGGIARESYELSRNLVLLNENVIVLTVRIKGYYKFDKMQQFVTIRVPTNFPLLRELFLFLYFPIVIRKYNIQKVINMMWFPCGFISFLYHRLLNFDYYVRVVGGDILEPLSYKYYPSIYIKGKLKCIKRKVFKHAKKIFAISSYAKNMLISQGVNESKIKIVYYGADNTSMNKQPDEKVVREIIQKYKLTGKKVMLTIARLDVHKGHKRVIEALPKIIQRVPNVKYLIVGDGPQRKFIEDLIRQKKLTDIVKLVGRRDDVENFYAIADLFIMLSEDYWWLGCVEGFGIVFLEAALKGVPVIGGNTGGIPDAVIHKVTGILVSPKNIDEIVNSVCLLLTDKELRNRLISNAKLRAEKMKWINTAKEIIFHMCE